MLLLIRGGMDRAHIQHRLAMRRVARQEVEVSEGDRPRPLRPLHVDRRLERRLIIDYKGWIDELWPRLSSVDYDVAVAIAELPDSIRGYGPVKERSVKAALAVREALMERLGAPEMGGEL